MAAKAKDQDKKGYQLRLKRDSKNYWVYTGDDFKDPSLQVAGDIYLPKSKFPDSEGLVVTVNIE